MLAPVLTRTSIYLFSMSQRIIFHCPVVLSEPVRPMKIVKPFWRVISVQILATSPSFFPWNPVCAISSRSRETLFLPTSIVLTGLERTSLFRTTLSHLECLLNYFVNPLSGFLPDAMKMLTVASASPFEDLEQQSSPRDSKATFVSPAPLNQLDIDALETLPAVVALGPEKLELVTVEVGDDDDIARPQNPRHLANCPRRFFDVMETHIREDIVDRLVFDRDPF